MKGRNKTIKKTKIEKYQYNNKRSTKKELE